MINQVIPWPGEPPADKWAAAEKMAAYLKQITPKGPTLMLSTNWRVVPLDRGLRLINPMEYAEYVNDGNTRGMSPRDMTGKAAEYLAGLQ